MKCEICGGHVPTGQGVVYVDTPQGGRRRAVQCGPCQVAAQPVKEQRRFERMMPPPRKKRARETTDNREDTSVPFEV